MRRLERLHAITNHLRALSPRTVPASNLADRFGVSQRTIERDLHALHEAGVPIYGVEGRSGGYSILPEHSMAPLQLTAQEAVACMVGLNLMDHSPLEPHARTALDKLRASLPAPMAAASLLDLAVLTVHAPAGPATAVWLDATRDRLLVELTYAGDDSVRLVEPYTTLRGGEAWYLVGWCRSKDGVRGFRVDRLGSIRLTSTAFSPVHASAVADDLSRWDTQPLA